MSNLKRSIFWLGFYLLAVFVLAEFDYSNAPIINFAKYFYFLVMLCIPFTVFMPGISKVNIAVLLIVWACVYIVVLQVADRSLSAQAGDFPVILLELILLEIGVWCAYQLAEGISHAESIMDAMALSAFPNRTMEIEQAEHRIKGEITRSRRYQRPLSLLVLQADPDDKIAVQEMAKIVRNDLWNRFSFARIGQIVDEHVRQTDIVMRDHKNRFIILCPETDIPSSKQLAGRITKAVEDKTGLQVMYSTVYFPDDALNFDDLLATAQSKVSSAASSRAKKRASSAKQHIASGKDVK
jgi:GGDEF domain-containing protein